MARINLLPWREELRKQQQQDFIASIGAGVLVAAAIMLFVHLNINGKISNQEERNRYLTSEIKLLDAKIKEIQSLESLKSRLLARMDVIQSLQKSRPEVVHLFDELATTVPDGVYINKFNQAGKDLTLNGMAQSNARVSAYMRRLEASPWLKQPQLNIIETKGKDGKSRASSFILRVKQSQPGNAKGTEG